MIAKEQLTAVILAGGKSQRMGRNKAFITLGKHTFIEHIIAAVQDLVMEVLVVANGNEYEHLEQKVYEDLIKNKGPVGGIYTALKYAQTPYVLVLSCDIPLVSTQVLQFLIQNCQPTLVNLMTIKKQWQPLIAVYKKEGLPIFEEALQKQQLGLCGLLQEQFEVATLACPQIWIEQLINVNTPDDLNHIRRENRN